ncbi:MAG TPA: TolC family protein [Candidatus Eisenbacteria bacterium]|uniref:TolC family protein n=1 Tax=Eiseniibacteriota bacterium TaxID=2212470 RepID=A0A7V2AVE6_UNCEI|nr:TolC family protein [Candidatus Eisenbacteria bacterium]
MDCRGSSIRRAALLPALLLMISIAAPSSAPAARVLSLEECIGIAMRNNPEIGMAESGIKGAENGLLQSYGQLLPSLNVSFTTGRAFYGPSSIQYDAQGRPVQTEGFDYNSYSFNMNSSIVLFDGGRNINSIRSSMKRRDAAREEYRYIQDIVAANVINKYYNFVRAKMLLVVAEESLDQAKQNLDRSEALLEVGSATRADVLKARVRHSNTRLSLIRARNAVEFAREDLVSVLSLRDEQEVDVDTTMAIQFEEPDIETEVRQALEHRPDLRSLQLSTSAARASVAAAKSGWWPSIGAGFNYGWSDRQMAEDLNFFKDEYSWSVGASISLNLFDRFVTSSNVGTARANLRRAEYSLEKAELDAIKEVKNLVFVINEAEERIVVASETVEQAREDVRLAEERYRVGAGTMLETIDAQVALTQAKADVIEAKCDYLIAVADLARATGRRIH